MCDQDRASLSRDCPDHRPARAALENQPFAITIARSLHLARDRSSSLDHVPVGPPGQAPAPDGAAAAATKSATRSASSSSGSLSCPMVSLGLYERGWSSWLEPVGRAQTPGSCGNPRPRLVRPAGSRSAPGQEIRSRCALAPATAAAALPGHRWPADGSALARLSLTRAARPRGCRFGQHANRPARRFRLSCLDCRGKHGGTSPGRHSPDPRHWCVE